MAVLQAVLSLISRSLGRIASSAFGWAVVALFGQTSASEKTALSVVVGAAAAWPLLLLGIAVPRAATFVLGFIPLPAWIPAWTVRVVWIALAVAVPLGVGLTMALRQPRSHRDGASTGTRQDSALKRLLRGFPITVGIAAAFLVEFVTVPVLRVMSMLRRRVDVQIPLVTDAASYDVVAARVAKTLRLHGFTIREDKPGWWMTVPSSILLTLGGPAFRAYIPRRLAYFSGPELEVALYPNALLLRGRQQDTAWAQGVVVEAVTNAPALQTFHPAAQDIERQIRRVWSVYGEYPSAHANSAALLDRLTEIARDVRRLPVAYDEWQVVYRQALQLGRALHGDRQLLEIASSTPDTDEAIEEKPMTELRNQEATRSLSSRALIAEIVDRATLLAKKELELAQAELRADLKSELAMAKGLGVAAVAGLTGLNLLLVAGVLALGVVIPAWLAAAVLGGLMLTIGAVMAYWGWRKHVATPLPVTRQTLKQQLRWLKERVA
jgi:Putative Actinobacterial Holin-X, holin superfamily III